MTDRSYVTAHTSEECDEIAERRRPVCQVCGEAIDNRRCVAWHLKRRRPYRSGSSEESILTLKLCDQCAARAEYAMRMAEEEGDWIW